MSFFSGQRDEHAIPRPWRSVILLAAVVMFMGLLAIHTQSYFGDEGFHFDQMNRYWRGDFSWDGSLTMLPGFHLLLAGIGYATGLRTLNFIRFYNVCLSVLSVFAFRAVLKALHPRATDARVLQYAFLPILFPLFFLVYTDVLALLLTLVALYGVFKRRYVLAALAGIASMGVRQNNIVWFFFFFLLFLQQEWPAIRPLLTSLSRRNWMRAIKRTLPGFLMFALGGALFVAFVFWNHGIAMGDKDAHPFPEVHLGNIYFCLFLTFVFFLPLHIANARRVLQLFLSRYGLLIAHLLILGFFFYLWTFTNTHPYNQDANSVFLRNRILVLATSSVAMKAAFFVPMAYAVLSLVVTRLTRPMFLLIYPLTVLYLLPSWLIEQRYYIVPFVFFLLMRERRSERLEAWSVLYGLVFTVALFIPVAMRWFFL